MRSTVVPLRYRIPWKKIVVYALAVLFALYIALPFYWIVTMSFMREVDVASVPPQWVPEHPTLDAYRSFVDPQGLQALVRR
jgi:multiple sugar transport system permease protein